MRPIIVGLFAAVLAVAFFPAASAMADSKVPPPPITPEAKTKGMAAAPGLIAAGGIDCQLASARLIGESQDPKTKVKSSFYEIGCKGGEGFIINAGAAGTPPGIFTCLEVAGTPTSGLACLLPDNADPKAGLVPVVAKTDPLCQLGNARGIGQAADRSKTVFEIACQDGGAYVMETSFPVSAAKPAKLTPCMAYADNANVKCTLTTPEAQAGFIDKMAASAGKDCTATNRRFVGVSTAGDYLYEVACQNGKGYVLAQSQVGALSHTIDCTTTDMCTLTDTKAAENEQAGTYTKLARKAGFECDVGKYGYFNVNVPGHEVVELACTNRPDGAVGIFSGSAADTGQVYDCAHSEVMGYRCSFGKPEASYASLTNDLKKLGKTSCVVSNSRTINGLTAEKHGFIEVGCADGNQGYMIEYATTPLEPKNAYVCSEAKGIAGGCTLPHNVKGG
ncbi:MAG: hypothetical protein ACHP7N_18280 [Caulobacterales bacterium]